jgi:two-component system chemotaxis sensor kinase CheA
VTLAEDDEIRALFEVEALERLTRLAELLLRLEVDQDDAELVAQLFREAHTLKGSADMVGLGAIAAEADVLETVLVELRGGARAVDRAVIDELLAGLDRLSALSGIPVQPPVPPVAAARAAPMANLAALLGGDVPAAPLERRQGRGRRVTDGTTGVEDLERFAPLPSAPPPQASPVGRGATARVAVERLDDLVRLAGEAAAAHDQVVAVVREHLGFDPFDVPEVRALSRHLGDLQEQALRARMLPVGELAPALRRAVRDVARRTGKEVRFELDGEATELDRNVHEKLADALVHIVRNAVDHGIEDPSARVADDKPELGTVRIHAAQAGSRVVITVTDDGRGIHRPAVRRRADALGIAHAGLDDDAVLGLLFLPGFSTAAAGSDVSGRGVGLDAVRDTVAALRGRVEVASVDGEGTTFRLTVPTTLSLLRSVVVVAGGTRCALALHGVGSVLSAETGELPVEGRAAVRVDQEIVPVSPLAPLLGRAALPGGPIVVLRSGARARAVRVDAVLGQREVLVKALPACVPGGDLVVGASAEADGSVLLVLDVDAVVGRSEGVDVLPAVPSAVPAAADEHRGSVLVVDDALTVRELQRTILERAGFEVRTASDGADALARLAEAPADLVLSDIEMEGMDGLGLTRAIRDDARWRNLPVVLLTSRSSDDDRRRGLEAGADAYIVKSAFDERALLDVVDDLLGRTG